MENGLFNSKCLQLLIKISLFSIICISVFIKFLIVPSFLSPKTENINFIKAFFGLQGREIDNLNNKVKYIYYFSVILYVRMIAYFNLIQNPHLYFV
jgi:hypothetical protein